MDYNHYEIVLPHGDGLYTKLDTAIDMARAMQIARDAVGRLLRPVEIWDGDIINRIWVFDVVSDGERLFLTEGESDGRTT